MSEQPARTLAFWIDLERTIAAKVEPALSLNERARKPLIEYLREMEAMARQQCERRETIQVIASGRRLLGDRTAIGPEKGPFSAS